jgi:hypothetical protein
MVLETDNGMQHQDPSYISTVSSEVANPATPFLLVLGVIQLIVSQITERTPARQPAIDQLREMLWRVRQNYQQFLASELRKRAKEEEIEKIIDIASREVDSILNKFDLSPDELVTQAKPDYEQAARQVLKRAKDQVELLDAPVRSLTERMIEDY